MIIPIGCHVQFTVDSNGTQVTRSYTPVCKLPSDNAANSGDIKPQFLTFVIKIYPNGPLTQVLSHLEIGQTLNISDYSHVDFDINQLAAASQIYLLAAGTGITPMIRIINWLVKQERKVKTKLIFFNKSERDILWKDVFETYEEMYEEFSVNHVLSEPSSDWQGEKGRISEGLLVKLLSQCTNHDQEFFCLCGPNGFTLSALQ